MSILKSFFFEALFRNHASELRRFASKRVGSQEAEDVVQDVYLRFLQQPLPGEVENPRAYLHRAVANLAINRLANRHVRLRHVQPNTDVETAVAEAPGPDQQYDAQRRLQHLIDALDKLPQNCRDAFVLNRVEGLTHAEIARGLGVSEKTVQRHILLALQYLEDRLAE